MDRCSGHSVVVWTRQNVISCRVPVDKTSEMDCMGVDAAVTNDTIDNGKRRKFKRFALARRKQAGDVVQLVRTLPRHR